MLVVETIARIRREHFIKGKTIKEIARDLKVSQNTVRKVLRSGGDLLRVRACCAAAAEAGTLGSRTRWIAGRERGQDCSRATDVDPYLRSCADAAMTAVTMPCGVTPGDGAGSADNRR